MVRWDGDRTTRQGLQRLAQNVQKGATDVSLGTLTIRPTNPGTSTVRYTVHDFRTDNSEQKTPSVQAGTLTVRSGDAGETNQPSSEEGSPVQQPIALISGLSVMWAAGAGAIVLMLLAFVFHRR